MRYFFAVVPPASYANAIDAYRIRFCPKLAAHCQPHITVLPPFEVEGENIERFRELPFLLRGIPSFTLSLKETDRFDLGVLFLTVQDVESRLNQLKQTLENWSGRQDLRRYHPHLTLAMTSFKTSLLEMERMEEEIGRSSLLPFSFKVHQVVLFVKQSKHWEPYRTYSLEENR
nr:2'-5' RNA ligase family protein [Bacilli bacterium]